MKQALLVLATLFITAILLFAPTNSFAQETAANVAVDTIATVNYSVGSVVQIPVESSPIGNNTSGVGAGTVTTFRVDRKVDLVVATAETAYVDATPGEAGVVVAFTVTNDSNNTMDFSLSALNNATDPRGGTENFDPDTVSIFVDSAANNGAYDVGTDTATFIDELGSGASKTVFAVVKVPDTQADGSIAAITLVAQANLGGDAGVQGADLINDDNGHVSPGGSPQTNPDDPATVQSIFADAAGDLQSDGSAGLASNGQHASSESVRVRGAQLTVTKTSAVVDDPINGTSSPKRIPGATIRYTVTVTNSGTGAATTLVVSDPEPVDTTYTVGSITINGVAKTDGVDADEAEFAGSVVTARLATLAPGATQTVTFDVNID